MSKLYTLITGGTSGIGLETAKRLISKGESVILTGRDQSKVDQVAGELGCLGIVADSGNIDDIRALANTLKRQQVQLSGLVLNAGIFVPESFTDTTAQVFDQTLAVNTKGPLFTLQALLPLMCNPSSVVFVSSIVVSRGFQGCTAYAASKAAGEAIVRVANMELADQGIRVNIVRPGVTKTPIQEKAGMDDAQKQALFSSLSTTPLGRVLNCDDQARAIEFLLSDNSLAMRNAVLEVEGGYLL
ncbi:SDR family oxidoreductase [Photobacterium sp. MCCC 1A19761]|uniref:SDR family oxidoreductase n=1 Tax=Photobacterium sp. MCCC 1A19761 TaxID=3115000 RepID=UPI00307D004D